MEIYNESNVNFWNASLASLLYTAGKVEEGLLLFGQVVLDWELALGPNHIRQSISYNGYAQMLKNAGRVEESLNAKQRATEIGAAWDAAR